MGLIAGGSAAGNICVGAFVSEALAMGINWKEQSVSRSQVMRVSEPVREQAPEIFERMVGRVEDYAKAGRLIEG